MGKSNVRKTKGLIGPESGPGSPCSVDEMKSAL